MMSPVYCTKTYLVYGPRFGQNKRVRDMLLSLSQSCFPSIVRALSFGPSFQITSKRLFILSITPSQNIYRRASQCNTVVPLVTTDFPFLWVAKTWINNSDVVINQETLRTSAHWSFSESQRLNENLTKT